MGTLVSFIESFTDFLTLHPVAFYALMVLVGFGLWRWELRCHPGDHPRHVARKELREQDRIWKKAR
jgi:hypothetical protein